MHRKGGKYMTDVYFVPWCRVGPYAVGLILGYILFATRCRYKMTKVCLEDEYILMMTKTTTTTTLIMMTIMTKMFTPMAAKSLGLSPNA